MHVTCLLIVAHMKQNGQGAIKPWPLFFVATLRRFPRGHQFKGRTFRNE